ncbi:unnamed protein product, partial [Dibothriocephalus latus]
MSEYRAQYLTYNCDPVKAIRPECTVHQTDEPLASETTHRYLAVSIMTLILLELI